ncbi:uncharacterized protein DNG_04871 [Cephalotrichum gorgonifer]|uniref:Uncharacterized protein n=1 Tax=Cephalotrichum gorgonifer TaxID=2041049 RepID=A0AAE8MZE0_9PEZI|nr:uncharacterized protein DNG_04871 [Cephalotrichum gorgonifer]
MSEVCAGVGMVVGVHVGGVGVSEGEGNGTLGRERTGMGMASCDGGARHKGGWELTGQQREAVW